MNTLFSLGYSGVQIGPVVQWLHRNDALLIDVRFKPSSSNPQWRQAYLERVLGSRYRWVHEFGNVLYRQDGIRLADPTRGIEIVSAMLRVQPVVLACGCAGRVESCHRWTAANLISEATGAMVTHLSPGDFASHGQLELL